MSGDAAGGGTITDGESGEEGVSRGPQDQVAKSPSNPKSPR